MNTPMTLACRDGMHDWCGRSKLGCRCDCHGHPEPYRMWETIVCGNCRRPFDWDASNPERRRKPKFCSASCQRIAAYHVSKGTTPKLWRVS